MINTPSSGESRFDDKIIRQESYKLNVPVITTSRCEVDHRGNDEVVNSIESSIVKYYEHVS